MKQCIELAKRPNVLQGWRKCRHLIIDEVSMVDGEFFEVSFIIVKILQFMIGFTLSACEEISKIRGATAPKSQNQLEWLLPDGSTGGLVVSKVLIMLKCNVILNL